MDIYKTNYPTTGFRPRFFKLTEFYCFEVDRGLIFDNRNNLEYETLAFPNMVLKKNDDWMHPEEKIKLDNKNKKDKKKEYIEYEQEKSYKENPYKKEIKRKREGTILRAYDINSDAKNIGFVGSFLTTAQEDKMNDFINKPYFSYSENYFRNLSLKHGCIDALALHIYADHLFYYKFFPEVVFNHAWGYYKEIPDSFLMKYNGIWIFEALLNHFSRLHMQELI